MAQMQQRKIFLAAFILSQLHQRWIHGFLLALLELLEMYFRISTLLINHPLLIVHRNCLWFCSTCKLFEVKWALWDSYNIIPIIEIRLPECTFSNQIILIGRNVVLAKVKCEFFVSVLHCPRVDIKSDSLWLSIYIRNSLVLLGCVWWLPSSKSSRLPQLIKAFG